jgi:hypothetical protein
MAKIKKYDTFRNATSNYCENEARGSLYSGMSALNMPDQKISTWFGFFAIN